MQVDVNIGDKIVVHGIFPPAIVKNIEEDRFTNRTKIILSWQSGGTSYVMKHDYQDVWFKFNSSN